MNPQIPKEYLSGNIERITYHNEDNGFCVLRVKVKGHKDLVTVTGSSPTLSVGEYIKCSGIWHNDRNYGKQFKADFLKALPPDTLEGIEKYLGSGLIKGIGPHFAKKLVSEFGDKVFSVIEETPELLVTLDGVGKVRANSICNNWKDQKVVREIMIFLQSHGVGTTRATRIFKTYGEDAISIVSRNPYQLAKDIRGIGFISADTIANNLGIEKNSLIRARAGLSHLLLEATSNGHCGLPQETLIENSIKLLEIDKSLIDIAIEQEISAKTIICDVIDDKTCVFLASYHFYEQQIAKLLLSIKNSNIDWGDNNALDLLPQIEKELDIKLADNQKDAVVQALSEKLMVITGGPGTGKTTLIRTLLKILESKQLNIKLCAPTGRAAKRLSETTGLGATTIHRLLEIDPTQGGFKYNEDNKLACDYLIVDESSMIDVPLFHSLIKSLPDHAGLLLVGDVDQLPSVGAGQVLKDIISSNVITTIKLTQIFRQAATSDIITNAHNINKGILPKLDNPVDGTDFYFIQADPGDDIINKIIAITSDRIPKKFKLDPIHDIQLLCPMQRGGSGARSLNVELQKVLNPNYSDGIVKFGQTFAAGDKVMQTENNYDKDTYNGDIGVITGINQEEQEVVINFYGNEVIYEYADLDQITLAYATTIHKSQGSEYPAIIVPITMQSYLMLKRNLIYTAVTRGKKLVIVIGQKKALSMAIKDTKSSNRYSKLKDWLVY
ncbi:MAG: ATP-dependent RecD-like DNA helicase [Rickettsiaceae bacterium]|nr:ATP-dependent RecD-like DNA helicase [Rickettsiaceae bacterium]